MNRAHPPLLKYGRISAFASLIRHFPKTRILKIMLIAGISMLIVFLSGCRGNDALQQPALSPDPQTDIPTKLPAMTPAASETATASAVPEEAPKIPLVKTACPFNEATLAREVDCFRITVPEDHNNPGNGRSIELPVALFRSASPDPAPDPIIYLAGGPGENALQTVDLNFRLLFEPYLATRDLIIFDQRGTGGSSPALQCPEIKAYIFEYLDDDLDLQTSAALILDSYRQCYDRLARQGVNFAVYNSARSAADVAMLRKAFGYAEWNLLGASYGTRLALTILRDNDAGVRSVILDSTYPLEVNLQTDTPANMKRSIDKFFAECKSDPACNTVYPDLETVFWDLVAEYNATPFLLTTANIFTRETHAALIYGDSLVHELFRSLYSPELTALFPRLIFDLRDGDTDLLARSLSKSLSFIDLVSTGMQTAFQCREENFFTDPDEAAAAVSEFEQFERIFVNNGMIGLLGLEICNIWETGPPADVENQPVMSDVPTLIVQGEFDPITPPAWGRQVAERFGHAYFFEFPGQGHGPGFTSDCARSIELAFIDNPQVEPDSRCIAEMGGIDFAVPVAAEMISLTSYSSDQFGISGLYPEGWTEAGPGIYSKWDNLVLQQAIPGMTVDRLASRLVMQLGLAALPEPVGTRETGALNWTIYQFVLELPGQGKYEIDMALAEANETAYLIVLQSAPVDYEGLHAGAFVPILEALTVP